MFVKLKTLFGSKRAAAAVPNFRLPPGVTAQVPELPEPLPQTEPLEDDYPVEALPPGLRRVVEAIATMTQAPNAIAAQAALAVVSLCFAGRTQVETLGSPAPACEFFSTIAKSGERKSAADKIAMAGVNAIIAPHRAEYAAAQREYAETLASVGRGEPKPPAPVGPSFLVTEPTVEGCFKPIATVVGFLGWCTDEAAAFWGGHSMSKDQRMKTSGILSKFWDYAYFSQPRASQEGDGSVPPTATTINLMFQPELIPGVYSDDFLKGQGILARMLVAWPLSTMGARLYRPYSSGGPAVLVGQLASILPFQQRFLVIGRCRRRHTIKTCEEMLVAAAPRPQ